MKVLELYSNVRSGDSLFTELGFDIISCSLSLFHVSIYPRTKFDIIYININNNTNDLWVEYVEEDGLLYGLDLLEYYVPKFWVIQHNNRYIQNDICMWGLPYQDVCVMRAGKLEGKRIWTNITRWEPELDKIYIKQNFIISELLQYV